MTAVTNQEWEQDLHSDDDYPAVPKFAPVPGAETDYSAADDELDEDGVVFDKYAEPEPEDDDAEHEDEDEDEDDGDSDGDFEAGVSLLAGTDADSGGKKRRPARYDGKVAIGFVAALVVAVVVTLVAATVFYGESTETTVADDSSLTEPSVLPTRTADPRPAAMTTGDRPLPYSADAVGSCGPGSTSAQTMAGTDPLSAFRCVRGGGDGQVIEIDLSKTYMITAISLTPGWVGKDASGMSQWAQHRVVTTVQYLFNDTDRTLVTQDTKNVHGEAVQPIKRVLASKIRMLIRYTSRPPAQPASGTPGSDKSGGLPVGLPMAPMPGAFEDQGQGDPVDAAFAISSLKIIGHEPL